MKPTNTSSPASSSFGGVNNMFDSSFTKSYSRAAQMPVIEKVTRKSKNNNQQLQAQSPDNK